MTELYSRRSFLAGVLTAGMLSASASYLLTRREEVTLTLVTGGDRTGGRRLLVQMWNDLNPYVKIEPIEVNSSTRDQYEKFISSHADTFNLDVIHIPKFAAEKRIVPITPRNDISLLAPVRRLNVREGSDDFWAVPFNTDVGVLYRRVTDKAEAGPDPTLAQVMTTSSRSFVGQLDTVGSQTDEAFVVNVLEQALAQDEAILDESGQLSFSLGQWRSALEPLAAAIRGRRVGAEAGEDDTNRTFQRNSLRYMRNWPVYFPAIDRAERTKPATDEIRLGRVPIGIIGGQSLAVSAESDHQDEAVEAIHFLTDAHAQLLLAKHGFAPTGLDAYIDPVVTETLPHLKVIRNGVESSRPRPMHRDYAAFAESFAGHTHRFLYDGEQLTQQFIQDIQGHLR
ncbi:trehalose/maltose ABC transporter substrate-binding protein [Paractinoplanes deccanensis]|uniref:Trehalose/maltose ABC transporter substrate-binding protein n=1 Tax=Paractinoplanes deccanensis TaxID=113561 RepID=A0ABQ3Y6P7_9ACTN|nr:ABC transporter-binding protein [Actinoplanes deccanensis]GID75655.1 trehalose/maltose ABC transporter substrate-binding protein [Actinoplanes deccanensis]